MASYGPAIDRLAFVLDLSHISSYSPATISGTADPDSYAIVAKSYALPIAYSYRNPDGLAALEVKTHADSSVTTNRHIRAAHMVASRYGYRRVADLSTGFTTYVKEG